MITKLQNKNFIRELRERRSNLEVLEPVAAMDLVHDKKDELSYEERMQLVVEFQGSDITLESICERERISQDTFLQWNEEFLKLGSHDLTSKDKVKSFSENEKYEIVIEGKSGNTSVAEICRRENITHETFLEWGQSFRNLRKEKSRVLPIDLKKCKKNISLVKNAYGENVLSYIENYIDFMNNDCYVDSRQDSIDFEGKVNGIVSLYKINDVRYINKYFEKINSKLNDDGLFVGCLETIFFT